MTSKSQSNHAEVLALLEKINTTAQPIFVSNLKELQNVQKQLTSINESPLVLILKSFNHTFRSYQGFSCRMLLQAVYRQHSWTYVIESLDLRDYMWEFITKIVEHNQSASSFVVINANEFLVKTLMNVDLKFTFFVENPDEKEMFVPDYRGKDHFYKSLFNLSALKQKTSELSFDKESLASQLHSWCHKLASFEDEGPEYVLSIGLIDYLRSMLRRSSTIKTCST